MAKNKYKIINSNIADPANIAKYIACSSEPYETLPLNNFDTAMVVNKHIYVSTQKVYVFDPDASDRLLSH